MPASSRAFSNALLMQTNGRPVSGLANTYSVASPLKSVETGQKVADVCHSNGISEQTYHTWKAKYGGLDINEARRLKHLDDENRRLKQIVADLTLDNRVLKDVVSKKW
jgi:putative transposase